MPDGDTTTAKRQCLWCGGWFFVGRGAEHSCGNTDEGRPAESSSPLVGHIVAAVEPREPAPATCEVCEQTVPDTVYWPDFGPVCVGCCNDMWAGAHDPLREALKRIAAGAGNGRPALDAAQAMNLAREALDAWRR